MMNSLATSDFALMVALMLQLVVQELTIEYFMLPTQLTVIRF